MMSFNTSSPEDEESKELNVCFMRDSTVRTETLDVENMFIKLTKLETELKVVKDVFKEQLLEVADMLK